MYMEYFGLKEFPFSLASDPRFLYLSQDHARVKAYIDYAMHIQDSFVVFTGDIGTGKTTLINDALTCAGDKVQVTRIQAIKFDLHEFLQCLLLEFGIEPYSFSKMQMLEKIKDQLHSKFRAGKKLFLIVDEAHKLDKSILEDIRFLSDMEINGNKLLSVILVGQPELNQLIDAPDMEHLQQRIRLRFHIKPLGTNDIKNYLSHRLGVAGASNTTLFDNECISMIQQFTGGRLRLINTLCDYALMYCFVEKLPRVTTYVVQKAANELQWETYEKRFEHSSDVTRILINPVESSSAKIIVKHQGRFIGEHELNKECFTIGRQDDNDIPVDDYKVSRHHAQILVHANAVYLHDLNSTNGTYLQQNKVNVHQLMHGEEFTIGDYHFTYIQGVENSEQASDLTQRFLTEDNDKTRIRHVAPVVQLNPNGKSEVEKLFENT